MRITTTLLALLCASGLFAQAFTTVTDDSFVADVDYTLSADTIYLFDGLVFIEGGATLNIEAGTVLQFVTTPTTGDNASALIITRGAQIFADGTAEAPIIMTYEGDDVGNPDDLPNKVTRGSWGGLIILGSGTVALDDAGIGQIEGIDPNEARAQYGGGMDPNDEESSGRLTYVSIRHAGVALAPTDEINGLTLGGVGSGTEIDYVEVFANLDDGIEFFGGTVDVKHAAVSYCGDDSFDYDLGWRGRGQYWFSLNGADVTGRAAEWDGAIPDANTPFSQVSLSNATFIGPGTDAVFEGESSGDGADYAIVVRDGAGARVYNSVVTNFPSRLLNLEDLDAAQGVDSYQRLLDGDVVFAGNVFGDFGRDDVDADSLIRYYTSGNEPTGTATIALLTAGNTFVGDAALLVNANGASSNSLDPRPAGGSAALSGAVDVEGDFFDDTDYVGAFSSLGNELWLDGWTALSHYGFLAAGISSTEAPPALAGDELILSPNPTRTGAYLDFNLIRDAEFQISVYDMSGRAVTSLKEQAHTGGQRAYINTSQLKPGTYVVQLVAGGSVAATRLMVN